MHGAHLFALSNVLQVGLEPVVAAVAVMASLKFSQCNVLWGSFPWVRGSGYQKFDSGWCFISTKYGPSISVRFWSHGAQYYLLPHCSHHLGSLMDCFLNVK
jgi:hypothetical protein